MPALDSRAWSQAVLLGCCVHERGDVRRTALSLSLVQAELFSLPQLDSVEAFAREQLQELTKPWVDKEPEASSARPATAAAQRTAGLAQEPVPAPSEAAPMETEPTVRWPRCIGRDAPLQTDRR